MTEYQEDNFKYGLKFSQSAKGYWYIDKAEVKANDIETVKAEIDKLLAFANEKLAKLNRVGGQSGD